jgi:nucleoside-diphosphate-sugar epimerase
MPSESKADELPSTRTRKTLCPAAIRSPDRSLARNPWQNFVRYQAEVSARLTGRITILTADKANEFFQAAWTGDPAPLMRDCGWHATFDLTSGLANTYQWYRTAGWL